MGTAAAAAMGEHQRDPLDAQQSGMSATARLLAKHWQNSTHSAALTEAVLDVAALYARDLNKRALLLYTGALLDLNPHEAWTALARAAESLSFFPSPGEVRALCGRTDEQEGMQALRTVLGLIRKHGHRLRAVPGPVVRDKDDDGRVLQVPERGPSTPCPRLAVRAEQAAAIVGAGSFWAGIDILSQHPAATAVVVSATSSAAEPTARREAEAIEKRWASAWREAGL